MKDEELYSENRLKNELRMKPKAGAQPAAWFKSSYKKRQSYPVYRLVDCEHLPAKKEMSEKQREVIHKMIVAKKLKQFDEENKYALETSLYVQKLFKTGFIILDTETTGLNYTDQLIELCILSSDGNIIHNQRYKPTIQISEGAYRCHGIHMHDLEHEPSFQVDADRIKDILLKNDVVIFNASYDMSILKSTYKSVGVNHFFLNDVKDRCAMNGAACIYGSTNRYGTISLADAASASGFINPNPHSALGDCQTTLAVIHDLANFADRLKLKRKNYEQKLTQ
jgi:DNA polymerase-3 subunit epsilon